MVVVVVMMVVMIMMMVIVVMMIVMVVMMVIILGHYHRLVFRDGTVSAAIILGAQNVLSIRNGIQQLSE